MDQQKPSSWSFIHQTIIVTMARPMPQVFDIAGVSAFSWRIVNTGWQKNNTTEAQNSFSAGVVQNVPLRQCQKPETHSMIHIIMYIYIYMYTPYVYIYIRNVCICYVLCKLCYKNPSAVQQSKTSTSTEDIWQVQSTVFQSPQYLNGMRFCHGVVGVSSINTDLGLHEPISTSQLKVCHLPLSFLQEVW